MSTLEKWDIVALDVEFIPGDRRRKYLLCIDPTQYYFMIINTEPRWKRDAQLRLEPSRVRCLRWESWLDTSKLHRLQPSECQDLLDDYRPAHFETRLSVDLRRRVQAMVKEHGLLTREQEDLVLDDPASGEAGQ